MSLKIRVKVLLNLTILFSLPAFANENFWPHYAGDHQIVNWTCQSTSTDPGCLDSALIRVSELNGLTQIDVLDVQGRVLRRNELKEKNDPNNSYMFGGTKEAPTFTVEAKDSRGKTYFLNIFTITNSGFIHYQESDLGGFKKIFRREFTFKN